jgi:hypothetical protein
MSTVSISVPVPSVVSVNVVPKRTYGGDDVDAPAALEDGASPATAMSNDPRT